MAASRAPAGPYGRARNRWRPGGRAFVTSPIGREFDRLTLPDLSLTVEHLKVQFTYWVGAMVEPAYASLTVEPLKAP
jgi:hypothetical protein